MYHFVTETAPHDEADKPVLLKGLPKDESEAMMNDLRELEADCWDRGVEFSDLGLFVAHSIKTMNEYKTNYMLNNTRYEQLG